MPVYVIETNAGGEPLDPVVGWHGPIETTISCAWIAQELDADEDPIIVPEIEFPNCRHHRRPDWLHTGVRPPRPMPRGLRLAIVSADGSAGDEPPGIMEASLECWDDNPDAAAPNVCDYATTM
ncbi:unnamed protein product, partial [marine sediment metagenome]